MYDGWVYIAKSDTGHYKIGRSKTPVERVKHFDTIMPVEVAVVSMIPCDDTKAAEKRLHKMYDRYREKGEWFIIPDKYLGSLLNFICYLNGEFIERHGESKLGPGYVNSCCVDFHYQMKEAGR